MNPEKRYRFEYANGKRPMPFRYSKITGKIFGYFGDNCIQLGNWFGTRTGVYLGRLVEVDSSPEAGVD